jgi:hypothetical protein
MRGMREMREMRGTRSWAASQMLYVDPLKRITIPEIRQHSWFATSLPRYLAVPPPDTLTEAQKVRISGGRSR